MKKLQSLLKIGPCILVCVTVFALTAAGPGKIFLPQANAQDSGQNVRQKFPSLSDDEVEQTSVVPEVADAPYISGAVKRPFIYFRQLANRRWRPGMLFFFLFIMSAALKLLLPRLTEAVTARARGNLFSSLASAFFYATILMSVTRLSFNNPDLSAMGIFCFGLVQFSFCLGGCLGANTIAELLYTKRPAPASTAGKVMLYGLSLLAVSFVITLISLIPSIGHLPRLGNRMVALIAALGLGGLVNLAAGGAKKNDQAG
jgi:hypothetical protein